LIATTVHLSTGWIRRQGDVWSIGLVPTPLAVVARRGGSRSRESFDKMTRVVMMVASNIDGDDAIVEDTEVESSRWRTFTM
jgi:hypothetical protein